METLLQAVKRVERKLDIVIRAIYEHDEDIHDEYGRSQRTIDAGRNHEAEEYDGDVLGDANESSIAERDVSGVPEIPRAPIANRSSKREANPPRGNGKVQREEYVSRGNRENKNVPREDGVRKHASSKSNATNRGRAGGNGKGGSNGKARGSDQGHNVR